MNSSNVLKSVLFSWLVFLPFVATAGGTQLQTLSGTYNGIDQQGKECSLTIQRRVYTFAGKAEEDIIVYVDGQGRSIRAERIFRGADKNISIQHSSSGHDQGWNRYVNIALDRTRKDPVAVAAVEEEYLFNDKVGETKISCFKLKRQ